MKHGNFFQEMIDLSNCPLGKILPSTTCTDISWQCIHPVLQCGYFNVRACNTTISHNIRILFLRHALLLNIGNVALIQSQLLSYQLILRYWLQYSLSKYLSSKDHSFIHYTFGNSPLN